MEVRFMNFTTEQKQLLYSALISYGNKLSNMAKEIPNEIWITDMMTDKARQSWNLAREIIKDNEEEEWLKCVNGKLKKWENLNRFSKQMATVKSGVTVVILFIVTEITRLQWIKTWIKWYGRDW